jgi:ABC-type enterochelin transport system ATPase subunit
LKASFQIVEIGKLKIHEEVKDDYLRELAATIERDGCVKVPIVADDTHYVILDGHHRIEALRLLGCKKAPVYLVDYSDSDVIVDVWPGAVVKEVKKEEVIERGLNGDLFPPKTTKHVFNFDIQEKSVDLRELY